MGQASEEYAGKVRLRSCAPASANEISLHLLTDPTCVRHPSKQREAKQQEDVEKKLQDEDEVMTLNDKADVDMEGDKKEEYTPRPHGSFDE